MEAMHACLHACRLPNLTPTPPSPTISSIRYRISSIARAQTKSIMDTLPRLLRLKLACAINKRLFAKVASLMRSEEFWDHR